TFGEKFKEEEISVNDVYYILSRSTDIKLAKGTHLIEITAFSDDNAEAAAIANQIALVYSQSPLAASGADAKLRPQIIDAATPAVRPARPNKPLNIGSGMGVGAILAVLGIWLIFKSNVPSVVSIKSL